MKAQPSGVILGIFAHFVKFHYPSPFRASPSFPLPLFRGRGSKGEGEAFYPQTSPRRRPGSTPDIFAVDSGFRRNDGEGVITGPASFASLSLCDSKATRCAHGFSSPSREDAKRYEQTVSVFLCLALW